MKKFLFLFTVFCSILVLSANEIVPKGTYSNLLANGKLELYAGTFPQSWRYVGASAPGYSTEGGYNNGGRFIFTKKNAYTAIRQNWTFHIIPGEKYRFRAKIRAKDFKAGSPQFIILNNGWKKSVNKRIPHGTYDWKEFSFEFTGFESRGGYYSIAIRVNLQKSGILEISDVILEPATKSAFEKSTAYLKLIPEIKLVSISPRRNFIPDNDAKLLCRWFGDKNVKVLDYTVGGKKRKAEIKNNLVTFDLSGLKTGSYTVKAADKKGTIDIDVRIVPGADVSNIKTLNNLHKVLAVKDVKANQKVSFGNPRNGWVYFRMPKNMIISIAGKKLRNRQFIRLELGNHDFKVLRGKGKVTISSVTEVSLYAFATGPFFTKMPRKNWKFERKYMIPYVMSYFGSEAPSATIAKLRSGTHKFYRSCKFATITDADTADTKPIYTRGGAADFKFADGVYIDELSLGTEKPQVIFLKNVPRLTLAPGRDAYTYICGVPGNSKYTAKVFSESTNLTPHAYPLAELYLPNIHTDEKLVKKQIDEHLVNYAEKIHTLLPGILPYCGVALCQSNMPLNFTLDHEAEADFRVLLDMQLYTLANDPVFKDLGVINFWGGNYADADQNRWLAALFRHYVFEGKKTLLSEKAGLKLAPGHLKNAWFREKLKYWKTTGSVAYGKEPGGAYILKYFKNNRDITGMAVFTKDQKTAAISQTLNNLVPGKTYKIRFVTSGKHFLTLKVNGKQLKVRVAQLDEKRQKRLKHGDRTALCEAFFTAKSKSEVMELTLDTAPEKAQVNLHSVSVFPCVDYKSLRKK